MESLKKTLTRWLEPASEAPPAYQPIDDSDDARDSVGDEAVPPPPPPPPPRFSWVVYLVFVLLGVEMLWAWNMFLAAAPYFQARFADTPWILKNFQASILTTSTIVNTTTILILTAKHRRANYPRRIFVALILNIIVFLGLFVSAKYGVHWSAQFSFGLVLFMVAAASIGAALCQNGLFAYVNQFRMPAYIQGIMVGQGIAGVAPCLIQIIAVLNSPVPVQAADALSSPTRAAVKYFAASVLISGIVLAAFFILVQNVSPAYVKKGPVENELEHAPATSRAPQDLNFFSLLRQLRWLASAVFIVFALTMVFPVFTQEILSVHDPKTAPQLLQPACFIPLGFLVWNVGDLLGRMLPSLPFLQLNRHPRAVFVGALLRFGFLPLYFMCNIGGRGALVSSDIFYLFGVQFFFGVTNGYLGTTCMVAAPLWADAADREAAGSFMGLCLVLGLTFGSLLSFLVVDG